MALTDKDIQMIVDALEPKFDGLEERFNQRINQLESDVVKAIVDDVMVKVDDHEDRIKTPERVSLQN